MSTMDRQKDAVAGENPSLRAWLDRLDGLVGQLEAWGRELDWSTRRIEKKMEDAQVGVYRAPALLLQWETTRAMLEPIGRDATGAEGVVDLYWMPAYDDVARLFFQDGEWWLAYPAPGSPIVASDRADVRTELSRESFRSVLADMIRHAS